MVFSSFVFLLCFLPATLILYYVVPKKIRNLILVIVSLIFYAWGEPKYVLIMIGSVLFNYIFARLIGMAKDKEKPGMAKAFLIADVVLSLGILGFFKYTDFFLGTINSISGAGIGLLGIALPIGISFYTFQTMSYTIDVYRGIVEPQKNIITFAAYVTMFPQLIAGPIVQYKTVEKELIDRHENLADFSEGAYRFSIGLAKKILLANQAGDIWDTISAASQVSVTSAWLGAAAFTFQIYFDFSAYSDMAIGLGRMFGFHFLENFDHPLTSASVTEFWRRWHISLGSWFREYVYIPLGGNRKGMAKQIRNMFIVWFLTGLWHGASWNFVIWGLYYGILLMIEKPIFKYNKEHPKERSAFARTMIKIWGHFYTVVAVIVSFVIFAITDFSQLGAFLKKMIGIGTTFTDSNFLYYSSNYAVIFVALILCSLDWKRIFKERTLPKWTRPVITAILLVLSIAFLVGEGYNPFLYFRF